MGIRDGDVVAIIGAGGKHTLMYRLSQELAAAGRSAVLSSTTNLHRSAEYARLSTVFAENRGAWRKDLAALLADEFRAVLVDSMQAPSMYRGNVPRVIDQIRLVAPEAVVLVKSDGARKRLIKVPGDHEPVYPATVDVCVLVLSLAAIGKPLDEQHVHRVARVRALTGENTISTQTLIDVITKPGGYGDRLPHQARNVLYLSSCGSLAARQSARTIWQNTREQFHMHLSGDTIKGSFFTEKN